MSATQAARERSRTFGDLQAERDRIVAEMKLLRVQVRLAKDNLERLGRARDQLEKVLYSPPTRERRSGNDANGYVVAITELRPHVQRWLDEHGHGGQRTLAELARVTTRTIRAIITEGSRMDSRGRARTHVSLETADRLLSAMDMNSRLDDLPVLSAAQARRERKECSVIDAAERQAREDERLARLTGY